MIILVIFANQHLYGDVESDVDDDREDYDYDQARPPRPGLGKFNNVICKERRFCLEPQFEIDEDNCRRVNAKTKAELIELLRVGDVACQAQAAWRRAPEKQLNILLLFARPPFASE